MGQTVKVPTVKKEVNIVEDGCCRPEFGTGLVMICTIVIRRPQLVFKYKLPLEMSIDEEGKMTAITGKTGDENRGCTPKQSSRI